MNYIFVAIYLWFGRLRQSCGPLVEFASDTGPIQEANHRSLLHISNSPKYSYLSTNNSTTKILANDDMIYANKSGLTSINVE